MTTELGNLCLCVAMHEDPSRSESLSGQSDHSLLELEKETRVPGMDSCAGMNKSGVSVCVTIMPAPCPLQSLHLADVPACRVSSFRFSRSCHDEAGGCVQ